MKLSRGFLLVSLIAACGGGGGGGGDDVVLEPDAEMPPDDPDANPPQVCLADASYGDAALVVQAAQRACADNPCTTPDDPNVVFGFGTLDAAAPIDAFQLELYKGFTVFQNQIVPGTYTLAGDELNYATCGVCPRIFTDCSDDLSTCAEQQFFVTGGTVNITSINPNLTFTVSDLTFVEVTIDPNTFESTPVPGGCSTSMTSTSFDSVVQDPQG